MNKKRIVWIDIAKAIAIFLMIEGHLFDYGDPVRSFIYSFHMPLFFFLTGFTIKPAETFGDFLTGVKKDAVRLVLPYLSMQTVNGLMSYFMFHENAADSLALRLQQLFWGSAISIYGYSSVGMIWFLIALFWSKVWYQLIHVVFPTKYNTVIYMFSMVPGFYLAHKIYFPMSMDIAFVAVFFIHSGYLFKIGYEKFLQFCVPVTMACFSIWLVCLNYNIFIEIGCRDYPYGIISVLEAVCGCICVSALSAALESCRPLSRVLSGIGRHTMIILFVSFVDWATVPVWKSSSALLTLVLRPLCCFVISAVMVKARAMFCYLLKRRG